MRIFITLPPGGHVGKLLTDCELVLLVQYDLLQFVDLSLDLQKENDLGTFSSTICGTQCSMDWPLVL